MHDALVFDYDGVLADTEPLHWKSWAALLARYGIELGWDEYCAVGRGVSDTRIYQTMQTRAPLPDPAEFSRLNLERKRMVREWSLEQQLISPATIDLLKTLNGRRVGLVTSSERMEVEPVLQAAHIPGRFAAMVFGEDVTRHKPAPDPYLLIAQKLKIETGVAFEDS